MSNPTPAPTPEPTHFPSEIPTESLVPTTSNRDNNITSSPATDIGIGGGSCAGYYVSCVEDSECCSGRCHLGSCRTNPSGTKTKITANEDRNEPPRGGAGGQAGGQVGFGGTPRGNGGR